MKRTDRQNPNRRLNEWREYAAEWWDHLNLQDILPAKPIATRATINHARIRDLQDTSNSIKDIVATIRFVVMWKMAVPSYAFAHFSKSPNPAKKYKLVYISWGGVNMTDRGEYTQHIRKYKTITHDPQWREIYSTLEEYFDIQIQAGCLSFYQHIHHPPGVPERERQAFREYIITQDTLPMELFAVAWFEGYFKIDEGIAPSNLSWDFRAVMHHPADKELYWRIVDKLAEPYYVHTPVALVPDRAPEDPKKFKRLRKMALGKNYFFGEPRMYSATHYVYWQFTPMDVEDVYPRYVYCQKMIPLTVEEAEAPGDIHRAVWKETLMAKLATRLYINHITPGVSPSPGWFWTGGGMTLYESAVIRDRYMFSETGKHIVDHIRETGGLTANITDDPTDMLKAFAEMHVDAPPEILPENRAAPSPGSSGKMSDASIVIVYESHTCNFADLPTFAAGGSAPRSISELYSKDGYVYFHHLVFDYLWTIQMFAEKYSTAHTHITVEHMALLNTYAPDASQIADQASIHISALMISDKYAYMFPLRGIHGVINGWSRAVMLDRTEAIEAFEGRHNPEGAAEAYLSAELRRAQAIIRRKLIAYGLSVPKTLGSYSPGKVLDILCAFDALDILKITSGYLAEIYDELSIKAPAGVVETLAAAAETALTFVDQAIIRADREDTPGRLTAVWSIFEKHFADYVFDKECMLRPELDKVCAIGTIFTPLSKIDRELYPDIIAPRKPKKS